MGFHFQKRIHIFKGLMFNLSKSGTSWMVGGRGASVNVRGEKVTGSTSIPGAGISHGERLDAQSTESTTSKLGIGAGTVLFVLFVTVVLVFAFGH